MFIEFKGEESDKEEILLFSVIVNNISIFRPDKKNKNYTKMWLVGDNVVQSITIYETYDEVKESSFFKLPSFLNISNFLPFGSEISMLSLLLIYNDPTHWTSPGP